MNFAQFALDAIKVTNYLYKRFGKEKIYILAHSDRTLVALLSVQKNQNCILPIFVMGQTTGSSSILAKDYYSHKIVNA